MFENKIHIYFQIGLHACIRGYKIVNRIRLTPVNRAQLFTLGFDVVCVIKL